ncbi:MAG: RES domain-containing protein [Methyloprofundus sp.]|nr:RES domain-containing protein [Methyloprofundus sp.]
MLWENCHGAQHIGLLTGTLHRLVESQEQIATLGYVDTLDEQALLEVMLEQTKPLYKEDLSAYHYLLSTPFRYPPLKWGSRFGAVHEPSVFYGGASIAVTLAESAYYRFVFWNSIAATPIKKQIRSEHSLFSVDYQSQYGINLHQAPFAHIQHELFHPSQYSQSQRLGAAMRASGVEAFRYSSARDPQKGLCIGLFTAQSFKHKQPKNMCQWLCETSADEVLFKQLGSPVINSFKRDVFLVDAKLPMPA